MGNIRVGEMDVRVVRKRVRNIYLRVLPPDGAVQVTAPPHVGDRDLGEFVRSKGGWIEKQRLAIVGRQSQVPRAFQTGEKCFLWGRGYRLEVEYTASRPEVSLVGGTLVLRTGGDSTAGQREAILNEWYRRQLKEAVPQVLERCEGIVGVKAAEWRVKNMRTRWGTCNPEKRRIWLNLQLAQKPPECLEYIIIHELVHLLERSHNARFKGFMDRFYPSWREVKQVLNSDGQDGIEAEEGSI